MVNRRIIDQTEAISLSGDDYLVADNINLGTRKIQFTRLLSGATPLPPTYKTGLEISYVSTTTFSVASGYARSDDNSRNMQLSSSIIKDISLTFDLGNNAGCMPSGLTLQANTRYYIFLISTSGGTSDIIIDTDENCQNGLADNVVVLNNFDKFTKIGYFIANMSSQIDLSLIENNDFKIKTGMILPWASPNIPEGFLLCAGYELSRTTFSKLFSVIGTTWGAGNGTTSFNIPNLSNRYLIGSGTNTVGMYLAEGLPNIIGYLSVIDDVGLGGNGAFFNSWIPYSWAPNIGKLDTAGGYSSHAIQFNASNSDNKYGRKAGNFTDTRVIPNSAVINFIIKY